MSKETFQKSNCPFEGKPEPSSGSRNSVSDVLMAADYGDLQLAVDSKRWKNDGTFLMWIWNEYNRLITEKKAPPHNFGSLEFWNRILGEDESHDGDMGVDYGDLQLAVDSKQWKNDETFLKWIWNEYNRLISLKKKDPPLNFGSVEFWNKILGKEESQKAKIGLDPGSAEDNNVTFEQTWKAGNDRTKGSKQPFIADTAAAKNANLVPYSDSESDDEEQSSQQSPSTSVVQQGGHVSAPPPRQQNQAAGITLPLDQYYEVSDPVRRYIQKFRVWSDCYTLRFKNQDQMNDLDRIMLGIFERILQDVFAAGNPDDRVGLEIRHPSLRKVFHIPMQTQNLITADIILQILNAMIQSEEELGVDDNLELTFVRARRLRGGRGREARWNHREWMKKHCAHGGCFIEINNSGDNLCLPRALVVAKARIDKETNPVIARQWNGIQRGDTARCTVQKRMALDLMKEAGLKNHQGECGEVEIRKLQAFLEPEYQIKIFSAASCNFLTYQGEIESEKVLHLYHDNVDEDGNGNGGHFLVCSKPHVLFNRQHWCDICNKGFNDKMRHKCNGKCYSCFDLKACKVNGWKYCVDCNRWFRSVECLNKHKAVVQTPANENQKKQRKKESVCEKIKRCRECNRLLNWTNLKKVNGVRLHRCGEVYCQSCDQWSPDGEHLCFMRPPIEKQKKKPQKSRKRKRKTPKTGQATSEAEEGSFSDEEEAIEDPNSLDAIVKNRETVLLAQNGEDSSEEGDEEDPLSQLLREMRKDIEEYGVEPQRNDPLVPDERSVKIFFDFECTQEKEVGRNKVGPIYEHVPILCVAVKVCNLCQDEVRKGEKEGPCGQCGRNLYIFEGENCRNEFCKWLFAEEHRGATAIAHNAKGYDSQFLIQYLVSQTQRTPKVISKGRELMMVELDGIKVIDSMNFLPMALAQLPKSFDQEELKKGFFPFKFCTRETLDYVGPWPDAWYYDPGNMKEKKRSEFYGWYVKQIGKEFNLYQEMVEYCKSDVDILMKCSLKFEELFYQVTKVKPFDVAVTIAAACMHVFRKKFMKPFSIAIIPHGGYRRKANQSVLALKWLKWTSEQNNIYIQHARNTGEKKIGHYKVDGFDGEKIYEFHGCVWHGCPKCYKQREKKIPGSSLTMDDVYSQTMTKTAHLRGEGYAVVELWECELKRELRRNPEMKRYFDSLEIPDPMEPRDAIRGGRTNATRLYFRCRPGQKLSHIDVCSLYPWGLKWTVFPRGHPKIITENFEPITKDNQPYFGLIKCRVQPPRQLLHPVLPYKTGGKLMFPLCKRCADEQIQGYCTHSKKDRAISGSWVSTELTKALELGYEVEHIDEVWHYDQKEVHDRSNPETGLFTKYINCFLKLKIETSGWPRWVKAEEDKDAFVQQCYEREGIVLDRNKVEKNPGLRSVAKLMLNSFWGKFGQRTNMAKDVFVNDPTKFGDILFDDTNVVERVRIMSEELLYVTYRKEEDFAEVMASTNPVIAAFTTANCRLKLYEYLEKLQDRVCYFDTDSVIYVTEPGDEYQPELGYFLGDMTDELEDYGDGAYIEEFVLGGPKNYAYKIRMPDGKTQSKIKIRGFTLNYHTAAHLNRRNLRDKVLKFVRRQPVEPTTVVQPRIERTDLRAVITKQVAKDYSIVYSKRWVQPDFTSLPFGTCQPCLAIL